MRFPTVIATALVVTAISCATVPCAFAAGAGNGAGQGAMLRDGSCGRAFACATQNLRSIRAAGACGLTCAEDTGRLHTYAVTFDGYLAWARERRKNA